MYMSYRYTNLTFISLYFKKFSDLSSNNYISTTTFYNNKSFNN